MSEGTGADGAPWTARSLVTGSAGFVGRHLVEHLAACGDEVVEAGPEVDVTDARSVQAAVGAAEPGVLYHLAAFTHVGDSWRDPEQALAVNVLGTLHVLAAARASGRPCRVVVVSSSEVYGRAGAEDMPLSEDAPMRPVSPYAASKAAAEMVALQEALGHGGDVVRVRPFNHTGPGQSAAFAVPALARRVAEAEAARAPAIRAGNLQARRDFTDVRDVVRAYRLLAELGRAGEVYNVCSGVDVAIGEVLERLIEIAGVKLSVEQDPALARPSDTPCIRGDASRLAAATGWKPEIPLAGTLEAVLAHERAALA